MFIGSLLLSSIFLTELMANSCETDMLNITKYYREGENFYHKEKYNNAINSFQKSHHASNLALESCSKNKDFDFNMMYNYIVESENRIYQIREELLD